MKKAISFLLALSLTLALMSNTYAYAFDFPETNDLTYATYSDICRGEQDFKGMTIRCFYQRFDNGYTLVSDADDLQPTGKNKRALPTYFSCGIYAPAIAVSAITNNIILPNEIIRNAVKMKDIYVIGGGWNTSQPEIAKRISKYLKDNYKYRLVYKEIKPKEADKYLSEGYFTVVLVNKKTDFTNWRHWMCLIDYDKDNNTVVVVNSNNPTQFMQPYDWNYVKKNTLVKISKDKVSNSVAYRWKFNDKAEKTDIKKIKFLNDTRVYEHLYGNKRIKKAGYFTTISKNKKYKVVGKKGEYYKIKAKNVKRYYFVHESKVKILKTKKKGDL